MISTWISQKTANAIHAAPGTCAHSGHAARTSAFSARPPIQVWMPNQPHATTARSSAGMFAPYTPKLARHNTGKEIPYLVPACAFSTIGISTTRLPSRIVASACHQVMPCSIRPEASV